MNFLTYPLNPANPGSLIPVAFSYLWSGLDLSRPRLLLDAAARPKAVANFSIDHWLSKHSAGGFRLYRLPVETIDVDELSKNCMYEIVTGEWPRCKCGRVELYSESAAALSPRDLQLVEDGCCKLCQSALKPAPARGVVAFPRKQASEQFNANLCFPKAVQLQLRQKVADAPDYPILLTRQRETAFRIRAANESFFLDPGLFQLLSSWRHSRQVDKGDTVVVSGPDGLLACVLGYYIDGDPPRHVFLPKFRVGSWPDLLALPFDELALLLLAGTSWKRNRAVPNFADLGFIRRNKTELQKAIVEKRPGDLEDLASFNRSLLGG